MQPPLFHNFEWFNIKASLVHHSVIQEVDELLAMGATEQSTGSAAFIRMFLWYLGVWIGYQLLTLGWLPSDKVWHLTQHAIMLSLHISLPVFAMWPGYRS